MSNIDNKRSSKLIFSDSTDTILGYRHTQQCTQLTYTAWGYSINVYLIGLNAEHMDPVSKFYILGSGRRFYNSAHMRFNSPDSLSPFEKGGINTYAYCSGDPINYNDPSGSFRGAILKIPPRISKEQLRVAVRNTPTPLFNEQIKQHPEFQTEIFRLATSNALEHLQHHRSQPVPEAGLLVADYRQLNILKSRTTRLARSVQARLAKTNERTLKKERRSQQSYDSKVSEIRSNLEARLERLNQLN
ncbi:MULTISPECIES: RHS repeat-associated core domain-containing protein [unclassified Pseudomonas]|uniref:RHS repeat-associated core domain-containing protein n=1 Tax=unclassified Pseudomonas TaxID=196821 RepID=UPI0021151C9A|nr:MULTISPECIES: RHS repeat-associated core domain-containing protein [unclassified Pseudomonas]